MKKMCAIALLIIFVASPSIANAQQVDHIFQKSSPVPADSDSFSIHQLSAPFYLGFNDIISNSPKNPFPDSPELALPFLYRLASSMARSQVEEPFAAPNYGLGIPPPSNFINHENITEYELALERIHRYTSGNQ